jgi:hypothetical protein
MDTVSSSDSATIAFDRLGDGPAALCQARMTVVTISALIP